MDSGSSSRSIDLCGDTRSFFRERLETALRRRGIPVGELTEFYLVNLLAEFAVRPADGSGDAALSELFAEALEATMPQERYRKLRELGDQALCTCGFFADHLEHRGVSRTYVVTLGGRAYGAAGQLVARGVRSVESSYATAYAELADRFDAYARTLEDVREMTALRTPQDIVKLYDRWRQNRSPLLAERLEAEGVYPSDDTSGGVIH